MEGSVWEYGNRRMPPWKKRYCTISGTNLIISKTKDSPILSTTILVGASIKSVHHFLAGKLYAIEIATHTTFSLIAALLSEEEQNMWMSALKEASGTQMCVDTAQQSILCAQMAPLLSPSSPMVRQAARSALDEFMTFQLTNAQDIASLLESCVVRGHRLVMPTTVVLEGGSHSTVTTPVHNTLTNETSVLGKGSVLVAINEHSVASSTAGQVQLKLRQTALPMKLQVTISTLYLNSRFFISTLFNSLFVRKDVLENSASCRIVMAWVNIGDECLNFEMLVWIN